ncbi:MAG: hypothetical protein ACOYLK_15330, partial [Sphingomonas sp.]
HFDVKSNHRPPKGKSYIWVAKPYRSVARKSPPAEVVTTAMICESRPDALAEAIQRISCNMPMPIEAAQSANARVISCDFNH